MQVYQICGIYTLVLLNRARSLQCSGGAGEGSVVGGKGVFADVSIIGAPIPQRAPVKVCTFVPELTVAAVVLDAAAIMAVTVMPSSWS